MVVDDLKKGVIAEGVQELVLCKIDQVVIGELDRDCAMVFEKSIIPAEPHLHIDDRADLPVSIFE